MQNETIIAGFGGQGVLFTGKVMSYAALEKDLEVTWFPSYGPEMRGGTANCTVIISDEEIGSPQVSQPRAAIVMNQPSLDKYEDLAAPYATVIDIDRSKLPTTAEVNNWSSEQYVNALRHDLYCREYNLHVRQLLHVGYKIAADMGEAFTNTLDEHQKVITRNVRENILERHIKPIFSGI